MVVDNDRFLHDFNEEPAPLQGVAHGPPPDDDIIVITVVVVGYCVFPPLICPRGGWRLQAGPKGAQLLPSSAATAFSAVVYLLSTEVAFLLERMLPDGGSAKACRR